MKILRIVKILFAIAPLLISNPIFSNVFENNSNITEKKHKLNPLTVAAISCNFSNAKTGVVISETGFLNLKLHQSV